MKIRVVDDLEVYLECKKTALDDWLLAVEMKEVSRFNPSFLTCASE